MRRTKNGKNSVYPVVIPRYLSCFWKRFDKWSRQHRMKVEEYLSKKKKKKIDARRLSKSGELMQRNQTAICRWLSISCTIKTR